MARKSGQLIACKRFTKQQPHGQGKMERVARRRYDYLYQRRKELIPEEHAEMSRLGHAKERMAYARSEQRAGRLTLNEANEMIYEAAVEGIGRGPVE